MSFDFKISKGASTPLHEQLTGALRESIANLAPGTRLPSENFISRKFNLSRLTVARALNTLEQEGYLKRIRGSGSFVDNPTPMHIYYLLPCIEALKSPRLYPSVAAYAGALQRAAQYGCRLETLIASSVNIAWELNREVIIGLPRGSRLIIYGSWLRDIFRTVRDCGHNVAYIDIQAENGPETLALLAEWHRITIDRRAVTREVMTRLIAAGRRRIALVHHYNHYRNPCFSTYREALEEHGIALTPELLVYSPVHDLEAQYAVRHLLDFRGEFPFDAVVAATNIQAHAVTLQLRRRGLTVPEDVAVVSFNQGAQPPDGEFAQCNLPLQEAGECAVEYFCHYRKDPVVLHGTISVPDDPAWDFFRKETKEVSA